MSKLTDELKKYYKEAMSRYKDELKKKEDDEKQAAIHKAHELYWQAIGVRWPEFEEDLKQQAKKASMHLCTCVYTGTIPSRIKNTVEKVWNQYLERHGLVAYYSECSCSMHVTWDDL